MRTKVAITEKVFIDDKWYLHNEIYTFVKVTGEKNKEYTIKTELGFRIIPGEYCVEVPDTLKLDHRTGFQMMEDTMDKTTDYQKAYRELLGHKKPKVYSAETGKPITDNTPIKTDGRKEDIPRESETGNI